MSISILSSILQVITEPIKGFTDSVGNHYSSTCLEIESILWSKLNKSNEEKIVCVSCGAPIADVSELGLVFELNGKSHAVCKDFYCIDEAYSHFLST